MTTEIIQPFKVFTAPNEKQIRLFDVDGKTYIPLADLRVSCNYCSSCGGQSNRFNKVAFSHCGEQLIRLYITSAPNIAAVLLPCGAIRSFFRSLLKHKNNLMVKNLSAIENTFKFLTSEVLPFVEKWEAGNRGQVTGDTAKVHPVESEVDYSTISQRVAEKAFISVMDSRNDENKSLKDENAKLREEIERLKNPQPKKTPQLFFAERMFETMEKKNLAIKDVAAACGINTGTLAHIREGARALKIPDAVAVADYLDVSLDWLCGRVDE